MMKRIITFFLTFSFLLSLCIPVDADGAKNKTPAFYSVTVHVTDYIGTSKETVEFMIDPETTGVYIRADDVPKLTSEFPYTYELAYPECAVANAELGHMVRFKYDSTRVNIFLMGKQVTYTSPLPARFLDEIAWLPFDFLSGALNFSYVYSDNTLSVNAAELTPLTALSAFYTNRKAYAFDWIDEVGCSEEAFATMTTGAVVTNFLSGLLFFEPGCWSTFLTAGIYTDGYEREFAEKITHLFVTPSQQAAAEDWKEVVEDRKYVLNFADNLIGAVDNTNKFFDSSDITKTCDMFLDAFPHFAKDADFMEKIQATKRSGIAGEIAGEIGEAALIHKDADYTYIELFLEVVSICEYVTEMENADRRAVEALKYYGNNGDNIAAKEFKKIAGTYDCGWIGGVEQYFIQNITDVISKAIPFDALLGPASLALFAWDIVSSCVPYYENGLDSTESFLLSRFAINYQNDSYILVNKSKSASFTGDRIQEGQVNSLINSGYTYMKFSFIARDAAVAATRDSSLSATTQNAIMTKLSNTNEQIAKLLTKMDGEDPGFLPSESESWREDGDLADHIRNKGIIVIHPMLMKKPVMDLTTFPDGSITAEDAIDLAKKAVFYGVDEMPLLNTIVPQMQELLNEHNTFTHTGEYYVSDYGLPAYIININDDELQLFVPVDGECVWFGIPWDQDGIYYTDEYRVYLELNLLEPSADDVMSVITAIATDLAQVVLSEQQAENGGEGTTETTP